MAKEVLKFNQWLNEELDMNQSLKDLETDKTDAQNIVTKIATIKTVTNPEQIDSTKEGIINQFKEKKGSATVAALTLLELECQHRLYQIKTEDARKKFDEAIKGLDDTIQSLKNNSTKTT